jgi:Ni2+-binding GTPase involved in maturation of urease and hydrogenase
MRTARVRHLPLVEEGRLAGLWIQTAEGPLVLLGPESVHQVPADSDVDAALEALFAGREAVVAVEGGEPVGVLTRADVLDIVRTAIGRGIGRRRCRPVVMRLLGPAGAGKTTLMIRTVGLLRRVEAAVVQANAPAHAEGPEVAGAPVVDAPEAHWRKGLADCVAALGDRQLIIVEDRDGPARAGSGIGEDLQVIVVPAGDVRGLDPAGLRDAQAVVVTMMDIAPADLDLDAETERLRGANPGLPVFGLAPGHDDRGLGAWRAWVEGQVLPHRG